MHIWLSIITLLMISTFTGCSAESAYDLGQMLHEGQCPEITHVHGTEQEQDRQNCIAGSKQPYTAYQKQKDTVLAK